MAFEIGDVAWRGRGVRMSHDECSTFENPAEGTG